MKKFLSTVWEFAKMFLLALAIIIPIRYFLIQPFYVKGASMEPNFHDNEYLIVNEIGYRFSSPQRGDIIVFRYPKDPTQYFIKRIIGLPGETVRVGLDGNVYIGKPGQAPTEKIDEPYLAAGTETLPHDSSEDQIVTLDSNSYFVMGDNRLESLDSRSFGPLNRGFIVGQVVFRGWPFDKMTVFKTLSYTYSENAGINAATSTVPGK